MDTQTIKISNMQEQNQRISDVVSSESSRLKSFIRRRVSDASEAEDIMQDVLFEFVEAYRLPEPIEQVGAWLVRVARNRIIDRFRKKREVALPEPSDEDEDFLSQVMAPIGDEPEAAFERSAMMDAIAMALDELPVEQREVFVAHELDGRSFKDLSAEWGVGVNTLLARKRYAVLHLRSSLQQMYDEL